MVGLSAEIVAPTISQQWAFIEGLPVRRQMELSRFQPDEISQADEQFHKDFISKWCSPKNAVSPLTAIAGAAAILDQEISRRGFIQDAVVVGAGVAFGQPPKAESKLQNDELTAYAAEGMAWNLLMQIKKEIGKDMADLNAHAFYETANNVLRKEHDYKKAQETFEKLADSMLKLGAAKALNELRSEKNIAYRLDDIRDVIDSVIMTKDQPINTFKERFLNSKKELTEDEWVKGKKGDSGYFPEQYVWRTMIGEDGAYVRNAPAVRDNTQIDSKVKDDEITFAYTINTDRFAKSDVIPHIWLVARGDDLRLPVGLHPFVSLFGDDKTKAQALAKSRAEVSFVARTVSTNVTYP